MDKDSRSAQTFVFECGHGFRFTARTTENTVWLSLPEQAVQLPRVPSRSGTRYASSAFTVWIQGEVAQLKTETNSFWNCINNQVQAEWEHARLDGVDFRAKGNTPVWHVEITLGSEIVLVTDHGQSAYRFKTPEPDIDETARKTTYRANDGQHRLMLELEGKPCQDPINHQSFEVRVTVTLDERQFHGCGMALN